MRRVLSSVGKNFAYGVVDVLTVGRGIPRRVGGETIRFPPRFCRYYEADYEPETFRFLRENLGPGDVALDIGAHVGLFTVLMARLVGPEGSIFGFEPTPETCRALRRTVRLNRCDEWAEVRAEAVTRKSGSAEFFDTDDLVSNANSLVRTERHRKGFRVDTVSVDDFVATRDLHVKLIKIDVEGAELDTLRGAERTLREHRPAVALALHPAAIQQGGASLDQIWKLLDEHRYHVRHLGASIDSAWFCRQDNLFDVHCTPRNS